MLWGKAAPADELPGIVQPYTDASDEPLEVIEANEANYQVGSLCTKRIRRLFNEIRQLQVTLAAKRESVLQPLKDHLLKMAESNKHAGALSFPLAYEMHQRTLEAVALLVRIEKAARLVGSETDPYLSASAKVLAKVAKEKERK
ncbi:hypothetical protein GobsT_50070 [Gemmata obscuriglobus]|uniref:Uncharacterized protein n=1 Tax=Gemmata obscuriglobus TaxID=114 RepID=A0A2Z3GUV9_9BACT|nr:hypothetical protein [Gemmata obscuriglobus]AWM37078.1 hypothetical protein C1280_08605 [Gemmata obscuriglobus]QEG30204.1 hypothetical protein GobsT_50070 [Gemmata obscuriglobus]VTS09528.1 unnamed protein product [Gemmata obscuriglobus UQM 2246]